MSTSAKLAGFAAAVAAIFGIAILVGRVVGPVDDTDSAHDQGQHGSDQMGATHGGHAEGQDAAAELPGGLMVSQDGYTLALGQERATAGVDRPVSFTITGPDGAAVTDYETAHDRDLHLIAVRRDQTGFQHVHPTLDAATGEWSVELDLTPGTWRLFADFVPEGGDPLTLGTDLNVAGEFEPASPGPERRVADVGPYQVSIDGDLVAGAGAELTVSVTKDGRPVTDLEPYLGAYGHLVALRDSDLAYLHVHPDGDPDDDATEPGPDVVFHTAVPSSGRYYLYFDFQHGNVVRTASFAVDAPAAESGGSHGSAGHSH
ncbi:hypothetical protein [Nocardioides sp. GXZ039]|uniref:hypothetical protein n=1 Tax=Nocardioides sp. GXZ039 TaxID=3136018 RepID=UPI0030F46BEA